MDKQEIAAGFEAAKKTVGNGVEFWTARNLQKLLGYDTWRNFAGVIEKACIACQAVGVKPDHHVAGFNNMITAGKGAKRMQVDYYLSRLACYLIAMNGDPLKPEIAEAQQYFARETRISELTRKYLNATQRVEIRNRIKEANKHLASTAKAAGVVEYGLFQHAGYMGLYGMGLSGVKSYKGIPPKDDLLDRAGRLELSANEFRINLTEETLKKDAVHDEILARETHERIGGKVRVTIKQEAGKYPEDLAPEPSIKKLASQKPKKRISADHN